MKYFILLPVFAIAACATATHSQRQALLEQPVNCETAKEDIAALEEALPSSAERARSVAQSVTPVGAATGLISGKYDENFAILTGRTKEELEARIVEIETTCEISEDKEGQSES